MFDLKALTVAGIPAALRKVERYRLLNEPAEAESICLDVLRADPSNQQALIMLLLALTDQFEKGSASGVSKARELLPALDGEYDRAYYAGIICERRATALLAQDAPGSASVAYGSLREAMDHYERAEAIRPSGDDSALLRWNTCARIIMRSHTLVPGEDERLDLPLE
jgi:tetratricopeptide (TPR) repeat protein